MARPSSYDPAYCDQARKLCKLGATDVEIADFFGIDVRTLYRWKNDYAEFCQALKEARTEADSRVEQSLYHRAIGYSFDSEEIRVLRDGQVVRVPTREHVPPDTTAMIFWLKNRQPERWRDVHKHELGGVGAFDKMTDAELREFIAAGVAEQGKGRARLAPPRGNGPSGSQSGGIH